MMADAMRTLLLGLSVVAAGAWAAGGQQAAGAELHGDAARGRELSDRWCVSCHRTDSATLNDQVPSLTAIAGSGRTEASMRGFLVQQHPPMPPLSLSNQQIADVLAYLNTLKRKP